MRHMFAVVSLLFVQKWDAIDRMLCTRAPWYIRLPWCSLWVRQDEFHPSLDSNHQILLQKILFQRKWLREWFNITRLRPVPKPEDSNKEELMLLCLEKRIRKEYELNLAKRRYIAHHRDETPSLS